MASPADDTKNDKPGEKKEDAPGTPASPAPGDTETVEMTPELLKAAKELARRFLEEKKMDGPPQSPDDPTA